ncbi:hypothetical protein [Hymenobacter fodinae]|uniref:hypothetical protein n=1 Tax=Hymenobacter fodinae TaxID=2510796 RepID=UPI001AEBC48D|nr:hypothetical protein [Hymenobacter fodinae]
MSKQLMVPSWHLLVVMATYGGWLMVALTGMFWQWSGMASLGLLYLLVVAPVLMLVIAIRTARLTQLSRYHRWIFNASVLYLPIAAGLIISAVLLSK